MKTSIQIFFILLLQSFAFAQVSKPVKPQSPVASGPNGRLVYAVDVRGNRIPDFSYAGYMASSSAIPDVPAKVFVPFAKGDVTARIQSAIDYVSNLPIDADGFRGAVLLDKGRFEVSSLKISASGVVLRGSGSSENGTTLYAVSHNRDALIKIAGSKDRTAGPELQVINPYVPVNAMKLNVPAALAVKAGDKIVIHRPSTKRWIDDLGTDHFGGGVTALGWKPGQRDIFWDREVVAKNGDEITIDAPITNSLDSSYGGGLISVYTWPGRISKNGVENMRCVSAYDLANPKDEAHCWMAVTMENNSDAWVRQVKFEHFAGSAVEILESAKRITVEDCKSLAPVSEIGGQRRSSFFTEGQQTLFQRCYAEFGFHDFSTGFCAPGPNAFVQCESYRPYSFSGTVDSWSTGVLFDIVNVDGQALSLMNRGQDGQGAGWSAANSMIWQCAASRIDCFNPPTAGNWAYGNWAQFSGDAYWESSNEQIKPRSFFYAQLNDRLGAAASGRAIIIPFDGEASSSPPVSVAMELTREAYQPAKRLTDFIDEAAMRQPISSNSKGVQQIVNKAGLAKKPTAAPLQIGNGWLLRSGVVVTGMRDDVPWWTGSSRPYALKESKPAITRFVPGKTGKGLTDDLAELTDTMLKKGVVGMEQNYALWYERRRDDHERIRRMDGDVWPPFYEVPFARSGKDTAWDGLSKYDLTKYNQWYWGRLKHFADLADQKGLLLVHQNYFQHNIIEAGAHYADFTWRPVNNINNTGFPEPAPYAGDKRIFMAEQFYDISNPVRRKLHVAYIRQCLNNFKDNNSVIQLTGAEFTGPFHFVKFWLTTIRDWEKETGKNAIVGLSTTKDVQDSILADKSLAAIVDIIDIRYWHYRDDGTAYEPKGGQNLAPRQHARLIKPGKTSFEQVYRAVKEYRERTGKAVMYTGDAWDSYGWAALMAGGSLPVLPGFSNPEFINLAAQLVPLNDVKNKWTLGKAGLGYIVYSNSETPVVLDLTTGQWKFSWLDPKTGKEIKTGEVAGGKEVSIEKTFKAAAVLMLRK